MTTAGWIAWAVLLAALVLICWSVWADRHDWADLSADLDVTDKRVDDLTVELSHMRDHLDDDAPSNGRHAATTEINLSKEPQR